MRKSRFINTYVVTALVLVNIYETYSQINNVYGNSNEVLRVNKNEEVTGTPYLYSDWTNGRIWDRTGKETANVQLRYDTYNDRLEIIVGGAKMVSDPNFIIKASLQAGERHRIFCNGFTNVIGGTSKSYYEVLLDAGTIEFLKKTKTIMTEEGAGYGSSGKVTRFSLVEKFYLIIGDNAASAVKLTKKSFIKDGGIDKIKIEDYAKKNALKTEEDFINFLKFYAAFSE
jgi:hypothetical protein